MHGDAADPEVEGMMPIVEVALDSKREGADVRHMASTSAAAAMAGCRTAG